MDRTEARARLGVRGGASRATVEAAFRRRVMDAHPDRGGNSEDLRLLVESRTLLIAPPARLPVPEDRRSRLARMLDRLRGRRWPTGRVV